MTGPKLPVTQLTILSICRFAEPLALTSVFPYLPAMIESFHVPKNQIAKWVGITSAVFSLAQMLTGIPLGRASDKYGRKPAILLTMTGAMASSLLFGFSRSLQWAIVARACSGASSGNVGILRTTVAEMVPQKALQPRAFAVLPLVWQIGSILGPILGGCLASPATMMPQLFGRSRFFKTFPYALPNLVCVVFFTLSILTGFLFLKESLEAKKNTKDFGRIAGERMIRCCRRRPRTSLHPADDFESRFPKKQLNGQPDVLPRYRDVFSTQANINLLAYCILGLHALTYDQLIPVFMHLPVRRHGIHLPLRFSSGFGLDTGRIGLLFTIYAVFSMFLQFTLFPVVTKRFGVLNCFRACTMLFPITYFVTPYTVLIPTSWGQQTVVTGVMLLKAVANIFAFPCATILLTNSASSLSLLGTLNGIAVCVAAMGRAAGPYIAGAAFTWGAENGYIVTAWWLLAVFGIVGHVTTWWLKDLEGFSKDSKEDGKHEDAVLATQEQGFDTIGVARGWQDEGGTLEMEAFSISDDTESDAEDDELSVEGKPLLPNRAP